MAIVFVNIRSQLVILSLTCTVTAFISTGCAKAGNVSTERLTNPIMLKAIVSYLPYGTLNKEVYIAPYGVNKQVDYRIYAASKWSCNYKTADNNYVCCASQFYTPYIQWKYCLLVDQDYNAFGYFNSDSNAYSYWPEGKKPIFRRI
jgi:hypothetical protein